MKDIYIQLSEAYKFPDSKYFPKILKMCLSEEEVKVLFTLPGTVEDVAKMVKIETATVQSVLEDLFSTSLKS